MAQATVDKSSGNGGKSGVTAYDTVQKDRFLSLEEDYEEALKKPNPDKALEEPLAHWEKVMGKIKGAKQTLEEGEEARANYEKVRKECVGQSSGAATNVTTGRKKRHASTIASESSSGAATGTTTGRKKRKTSNIASGTSSGAEDSATGHTIAAGSNSAANVHPASKYGFHMLVSKKKIEAGDQMRIPLTAGENPDLSNPDFVILEYRGNRQKNWMLMASEPLPYAAKGPKDFKRILDEHGIRGYDKNEFSNKVEMLHNGQSLGTITAMKQQILDDMRTRS